MTIINAAEMTKLLDNANSERLQKAEDSMLAFANYLIEDAVHYKHTDTAQLHFYDDDSKYTIDIMLAVSAKLIAAGYFCRIEYDINYTATMTISLKPFVVTVTFYDKVLKKLSSILSNKLTKLSIKRAKSDETNSKN